MDSMKLMKRSSIKAAGLLGMAALLPQAKMAWGSEWHLLQVDEVSATYDHYLEPAYGDLFPEVEKDGLAVNIDSTVARYFFWNSQVHGVADDSQYRSVGLYMQVGVRVSKNIDLSVWHHSQHVLDEPQPYGHFPVENAVQLKVYFLRTDNHETLF